MRRSGKPACAHFQIDERLRDHADDVAAVFHDRIRQHAHEADVAPTVDEGEPASRQYPAELLGHRGVLEAGAGTRPTEHTHTFHAQLPGVGDVTVAGAASGVARGPIELRKSRPGNWANCAFAMMVSC